jgi:uncharacterized membrane protein
VVPVSDDLDETIRANAYRFMLVVVAALVLKLGFRLWGVLAPQSWVGAVTVLYLFGTGVALLVLAVVDVDMERWGTAIALWTSFVVLAAGFAIVLLRPGTHFGTDAVLFSRYSADLLLSGRNPYAESMAPAAAVYNTSVLHMSPKVDGTSVASFSYPAGEILAFVPEAALDRTGSTNLMVTLYLLAAAVLIGLVLESPAQLAVFPLITLLGSRNLIWTSMGGLVDAVWLLPLLAAMHYWHADRRGRAAFAFGLAAGTKQLVWPIAPFLAIWLWNDAADVDELKRDVATTLRWGLAGFLALNLPFIVWDPEAWVYGVLTPVAGGGAAMVHQGVGLTVLTVSGIYALPKGYFTAVLLATLVAGLIVYALNWERAKWAAWVVPPVLFFVHYRSLMSYFTYFVPVAYYALVCQLDVRRESWPTLVDAREVVRRVAAA